MNNIGVNILASSIVLIAFLIICTLIYYIINIKNIKKSKKYYEDIHKNIESGRSIEFCGGIKGKVLSVKGDDVEVKVSGGATMTISRYIVTKVV